MSATSYAVVLSLVAGLAGAMQASVLGAFGKRIGVLEATAFAAVLGALLVVALTLVVGRGAGIAGGLSQPPWLWLSGPLGAFVVLTLTYAPPRLGTFATVALLISGQLAAGALIDAFGLVGSERIALTPVRVAGLVLLAAGAALTLRR
jgi:bacterial/archaeal transporter family-2 protein